MGMTYRSIYHQDLDNLSKVQKVIALNIVLLFMDREKVSQNCKWMLKIITISSIFQRLFEARIYLGRHVGGLP